MKGFELNLRRESSSEVGDCVECSDDSWESWEAHGGLIGNRSVKEEQKESLRRPKSLELFEFWHKDCGRSISNIIQSPFLPHQSTTSVKLRRPI